MIKLTPEYIIVAGEGGRQTALTVSEGSVTLELSLSCRQTLRIISYDLKLKLDGSQGGPDGYEIKEQSLDILFSCRNRGW
jgi:hypothetical protein